MSITSIFNSIETFIANFFGGLKKEWNNLEPVAKTYIEGAIKFMNLVKAQLANPTPLASVVITAAEALLGTSLTQLILSVLGEVLVDLGIVDTALTDPEAALNQLLTHLAQFKGNKLADEIYNAGKYIVINLVPAITRARANSLLQWVYDEFFANAPVIATAA